MDCKKIKRVWIFIVIYPINYFSLLNEYFNHAVGGGGKFMFMIGWVGIVKVFIGYLAMCGEVLMRRRLCICLCLLFL